ncbi:MAG: hypothetical protein IJ097_05135 [Bacilli bacterium]|nr:hypothetical protein [Bacilli bacterium]
MKNNFSKPKMSEYSFFTLLVAIKKHENYDPIINRNELEKKLYEYYNQEEFKLFFIDTEIDDTKDNNKQLNLSSSFLNAYSYGMITMIHDSEKKLSYMINITYEQSEKILKNYSNQEKEKMIKLLDSLEEKNKPLILTKK